MFSKLRKRLSGQRNAPIEHPYNGFSILLPADHLLPVYQKHHPKYDRFLPHLASFIDTPATIIDVGANCGDTLAGMVDKNAKARYVCVEPDDTFHTLLLANIARIKSRLPALEVDVAKCLAGKAVTNVSLEGGGGSKHAVIGSGTQSSRPLDDIVASLPVPPVRLLKSDVDGFDYDVLDSAAGILATQQPLVFFESQCDHDYQLAGFKKTVAWMDGLGYTDWTVFDNFGAVVLRTGDVGQLYQLWDYVWQQKEKTTTRTIYYFDVLAAVPKDRALVDKALAGY